MNTKEYANFPTYGLNVEDKEVKQANEDLASQLEFYEEAKSPRRRFSKPQLASLPKLLRILGTIVLIASAVTFVVQGWISAESISREYTFLTFTAVLAAAGIYCAVGLKDSKGARTFLAVAAAFVPAHFAQLGGLIYSLYNPSPRGSPGFFNFVATSVTAVQLVTVISFATLLLVSFAAFSALSRANAKAFTGIYITANALLLIPQRSPDLIALLGLALFGFVVSMDRASFYASTSLKNWEGRLCRTLMFMPLVTIVLRTLVLYGTSNLFSSLLLLSMAYGLFFVAAKLTRSSSLSESLQALSVIPLALGWFEFTLGAFYQPHGLLRSVIAETQIPVLCLPIAAALFGLSFVCVGSGVGYRRAASAIAVVSLLLQLAMVGGVGTTLLLIGASTLTIVYSFILEEKGLFYSGVAGMAVGLLYHVRYAIELYSVSPWLSLAIIGFVVLFASSYAEQNFSKLIKDVGGFRKRIQDWK